MTGRPAKRELSIYDAYHHFSACCLLVGRQSPPRPKNCKQTPSRKDKLVRLSFTL
jgi:hypothetical protein